MEPRSSLTLGSLLLRICVGVASVNLVVLVTQKRPRFKMANNRKCTRMVSLRRLQLRKLPRVWGATQLVAFWCWPTDYMGSANRAKNNHSGLRLINRIVKRLFERSIERIGVRK